MKGSKLGDAHNSILHAVVRGKIWDQEMTDIAKGHGPEKIVGNHMKRVSKVMSIKCAAFYQNGGSLVVCPE